METRNKRYDTYDVYIGRPSKWGNPFAIGRDGSRAEVIAKFEVYARDRFRDAELLELDGKTLGCFCAPLPCHGDVLIQLVQEARERRPK